MANATPRTGFYATADSTYYASAEAELIWLVRTDDLCECPRLVRALPFDAIELADGLMTPDEADGYLRAIDAYIETIEEAR